MYYRVNKQTGKRVTGTFSEVCNLDKRIWSDPQFLYNLTYHDKQFKINPLTCEISERFRESLYLTKDNVSRWQYYALKDALFTRNILQGV